MARYIQIDKMEAIRILKEYGSVNKDEKEWAQKYIQYQEENGRNLFYKAILGYGEINNLIFNEKLDNNKVCAFEDNFKTNGYQSNSFLCLRDLNEGESGSFYVENGKHRVKALKNLLSADNIQLPEVHAIIICRHKLI